MVLNGVAMRLRTSGKQRETRHAGTWSVSRPRPFQILRPAPPGFVAGLACLGADSSSAPGAIHWLSGRRSPGRNLQLPDSSSLWSGLLADGHRVNFSLPLLLIVTGENLGAVERLSRPARSAMFVVQFWILASSIREGRRAVLDKSPSVVPRSPSGARHLPVSSGPHSWVSSHEKG